MPHVGDSNAEYAFATRPATEEHSEYDAPYWPHPSPLEQEYKGRHQAVRVRRPRHSRHNLPIITIAEQGRPKATLISTSWTCSSRTFILQNVLCVPNLRLSTRPLRPHSSLPSSARLRLPASELSSPARPLPLGTTSCIQWEPSNNEPVGCLLLSPPKFIVLIRCTWSVRASSQISFSWSQTERV